MARRKDHTQQELKLLILKSARGIILSRGLDGLTARSLAKAIGYTPGTIYNFYKDMHSIILDINYETLGQFQTYCSERIKNCPSNFLKVTALAYAYVDYAHEHTRAWKTVFNPTYKESDRLPKHYKQRLEEIFSLIENILQECLSIPAYEAKASSRLLWACLHGITILTLDGRLRLYGQQSPHDMINDLLKKYLSNYL